MRFFLLLLLVLGCSTNVKNLKVRSPLVDPINSARLKYYFTPLDISPSLECAAELHAIDIGTRRYCSSVGKDGSDEIDRGKRCGIFDVQDQVVSCNTKYASMVVEDWMLQLSSRVTLLSPVYSRIGCARYNYYWVCVVAY